MPLLNRRLMSLGVFAEKPLRVVDAGCRDGFEPHWAVYGNQVELIGFEPDQQECERLNAAAPATAGPRRTFHPIALYRDQGRHVLHVTRNLSSSSLLKTNSPFVDRFPPSDLGAVTGEIEIATTDLDSFADRHGMSYVDFMKLDVEGAEMDVLQGAERLLGDSVLGLSLETFFQPYHVGRPLFADIDTYLRARGFAFFDFLSMDRWRRRTLATPDPKSWLGRGQLIWGQSLYLRDLPAAMAAPGYQPHPKEALRVLKLAGLAEVFNLPDFAFEVIEAAGRCGVLPEATCSSLTELIHREYLDVPLRRKSRLRWLWRLLVPARWRLQLAQIVKNLLEG